MIQALCHSWSALVERWELRNKTNDKTETKRTPRFDLAKPNRKLRFSENRTVIQNIETAHHYYIVAHCCEFQPHFSTRLVPMSRKIDSGPSDWMLTVVEPHAWNSLSQNVQDALSPLSICRKLKTFDLHLISDIALVDIVYLMCIVIVHWLLPSLLSYSTLDMRCRWILKRLPRRHNNVDKYYNGATATTTELTAS